MIGAHLIAVLWWGHGGSFKAQNVFQFYGNFVRTRPTV